MTIIVAADMIGTGTQVSLLQGENIFVAANVTVASTASGIGINSDHSYNVAEIYGNVVANTVAIYLGLSNTHDHTLRVHAGAVVESFTASAVVLYGTHETLINDGSIVGDSGVAIGPGVATAAATSILTNTGLIEGTGVTSDGVYRTSANDTDTLVLTNSGTIKGITHSFNSGGANAVDQITNTGKMIGAIKLDGGNDWLDTSKGTVVGTIDLGAGNDTVKGSAAGDHIIGGLGKDLMTGNKGADYFVFNAEGDSGNTKTAADRITDFSHSQKDHIDLSAIDAKFNFGANEAFKWLGTGSFTHHKGELHYSASGGNGYVSGDTTGDGIADFTIRLDHVTSLVASDFIL